MNVNDKAIKEKIRIYIEQKVLKATALRKLKKEFGVSEKVLDEFWLEVKQDEKAPKKENVIKDKKEVSISLDKVNVRMIKQGVKEAIEIKAIERKFETKCGVFIRDNKGVTFEGLTFKSKEDIKYYRDIIDMADRVMDMEV
ncbi:Uncharacterised protein [Clostridium paraputrificum]|uniref:hypothetical protein n=1 Tax=Clostridium paraputrificum TaxID=29363 RepID=UPI0006BECAF7|nr:hypothetical protein [Clostridium paraputrificum]CUQ09404.1 Uncharacterised protein [Clostridium paraputrificum]